MSVRYDAAVVGLGPAGRAVTHRLLTRNLKVLVIDPHPNRTWRHTLSGWRSQLPDWLPESVVGATARAPMIRTGVDRPVRAEYSVLDTERLQEVLPIAGADIQESTLDDRGVSRLRQDAAVVVDARGARPAGHTRGGPEQTAFGIVAEPAQVAALFGGAEAVLMDWRHYAGAARWGEEQPTFLYAIPLPGGRALVEETCLAGQPAAAQTELRRRLFVRATSAGVPLADLVACDVERVRIPLLRRGRSQAGVLRFGSAGAQSNPFSGYSVFASLSDADDLAHSIGAGVRRSRLVDDSPGAYRRRALRGLLGLSSDDTVALFDAFAQLPTSHQLAVLDSGSTMPALISGLGAQWWKLPRRQRLSLVRSTLGPHRRRG